MKLIPLQDWPKIHGWPTIGGLRHLSFYSATNGFDTAFKRVGRRVLVDEEEFFACVERRNREAMKAQVARQEEREKRKKAEAKEKQSSQKDKPPQEKD